MKPTIGRIVHYKLTDEDAVKINRRRTTGRQIAERIGSSQWPLGAQAHIGNDAMGGEVLPMIITAIWSDNLVNGQVFLDGNDTMFVTSVNNVDILPEEFRDKAVGHWSWPVISKPAQ